MKSITTAEFQKHILSKKIAPVYFLGGEETFLIDDCLKKIERKVNTDDLNREVFQAIDCSGEDIANAVETLPFLTDKRVVIVKMANKLKNADYEIITNLIEKTVDTACLILLFPEKLKNSMSKRKDLINVCLDSKNCIVVDCKKMYEKDLKIFIQDEFKNRNKTVTLDIVQQMIDESGMNLLNLSNEIEKICVYLGKNKQHVTIDDFVKISGFTKEINVFMLTNAIEEKNLQYAIFILEKMLQSGEKSIEILSSIATAIRRLVSAKSLIEEKNYTSDQATEYIKIPPYFDFRSKYIRNLSRYTLKHLKLCLNELLKADISIKTGKTDDVSALENFIFFICK
ncbi:MAG: DNA polymerase III subunit delta [Endomicrobiia bacterium]|nr:DNA polymerase III subunit delta [Endomicrobiaceae bacterium]MDD3053545.1 DNA polymerase III subunit delta [Endomicrobiaceae bacterium]MDD3922350.1 DNA polymerase III subunit delta [Endomicrobiaceae bacterium]MDD5101624.1 DNA polymerase III subunit delta [Endomicrobiaceae bacterium]